MLTRFCILASVLCLISLLLLYLGVQLALHNEVVIQESSPFWLAIDIAAPGLLFGFCLAILITLVKGGKHGL